MAKQKIRRIVVVESFGYFKVIKLQNTVEYRIGQSLSYNEIQALCEGSTYDVTVVPDK